MVSVSEMGRPVEVALQPSRSGKWGGAMTGRQHRDDGDDHQQFDERERPLASRGQTGGSGAAATNFKLGHECDHGFDHYSAY